MSRTNYLNDLIKSKLLGFDGVSSTDGVKITEEDEEYSVVINIRVYYGVNIPQLCYDIQTGLIKHAAETGGFDVKKVDIEVEGIDER